MKFRKRVKENVLWISIRTFVRGILGLISTILIVRLLTVEEYGIYSLLLTLLGFIMTATSFSIPKVFQRYIPELYANKDYHSVRKLVSGGLLIEIVALMVALLITERFSMPIGEFLNVKDFGRYLIAFSPYVVFFTLSAFLTFVMSSLFLHKSLAISQMASSGIRALLIGVSFMAGYGLRELLIVEAIFAVVLTMSLYISYHRLFLKKIKKDKPAESPLPIRRMMRFGGFSLFDTIGNSILDVSTDYLVLSVFLGPAAVGIYGFANRITKMFQKFLPTHVFKRLIESALYFRYGRDKKDDVLNKAFNMQIKFNTFLSIPFMFFILVLGDKVIYHVFDPKYMTALVPLWIIVTFKAVNACMIASGLVIRAMERVEISFKSKIFSIYNLGMDIIIAPIYGVTGIALVTGSAIFMQRIYCYWQIKKHVHLAIDWKGLLKIFINSAFMGAVLFMLRGYITNILTLAVVSAVGGVVYAAMARMNRCFSEKERNLISELLPAGVFPF